MTQFKNKITQISVDLGFIIVNKANLVHSHGHDVEKCDIIVC